MALAEHVAQLLVGHHLEELGGGHQARVFRVDRADDVVIAKVIDATGVDRRELDLRMSAISALAASDSSVCRPLPVDGRLVTEVATSDAPASLLLCIEFAEGRPMDAADPADAAAMGAALARLHIGMRAVSPSGLPLVAALRSATADLLADAGPLQLLHGDMNAGNMHIDAAGAVRIFDLEDCGEGPAVFDVANAVYMVMFDALVRGEAAAGVAFRRVFVDGYRSTGSVVDDALIDRFVDARVDALGRWMDDVASAPVGIRTAGPEWHETLRSVVRTYRA